MNIKKVLSICLCIIVSVALLAGCGRGVDSNNSGKLRIICTAFPQYDWVRQIVGEDSEQFEVSLLMEGGGDLHNFQPSAGDIVRILTCDLFIYVGGESDFWVEEVLESNTGDSVRAISLIDILGENVKEEEIVPGMEGEEEENDDEPEYDEHVWLSLKNAKLLVKEISSVIKNIDEEHANTYESNAKEYMEKLDELDLKYEETVKNSERHTILFGDRFPFRYMTDDYALEYFAAFAGCSAETEASFETIAFLSGKTDELGLSVILTVENSDGKIAEAIINNSDDREKKTMVMNSLQSVLREDINNGFTYFSAMEANLEVLKEALN